MTGVRARLGLLGVGTVRDTIPGDVVNSGLLSVLVLNSVSVRFRLFLNLQQSSCLSSSTLLLGSIAPLPVPQAEK